MSVEKVVKKKKKVKKKKRAKKKTEAAFEGKIRSAMRVAFTRHAPVYEEAKKRQRVETPKYNKDGSLSKRPDVSYRCESCDLLYKDNEVDVDHIEPVVEIGKKGSDYTFDEYYKRMNCDISNLQVLCGPCHDKKTLRERKARMEFK